MALLRNREVTIVSRADAADASPVYTVAYANGSKENVKLPELQLTEAEYKDMLRTNGEVYMHDVKKVDNKTLQEIRDSQDKDKIEARQAAEKKNFKAAIENQERPSAAKVNLKTSADA